MPDRPPGQRHPAVTATSPEARARQRLRRQARTRALNQLAREEPLAAWIARTWLDLVAPAPRDVQRHRALEWLAREYPARQRDLYDQHLTDLLPAA